MKVEITPKKQIQEMISEKFNKAIKDVFFQLDTLRLRVVDLENIIREEKRKKKKHPILEAWTNLNDVLKVKKEKRK